MSHFLGLNLGHFGSLVAWEGLSGNQKCKKFTNFQKKKKKGNFSGQNKQAGAELNKKKKDFLGQKLSKKLNFKDKTWPIIKKKKGHFRPKKQAGAELKNKKRTFLGKNCEKN